MEDLRRQVMQFIRDANLYEYADLLELLEDAEKWKLLDVAQRETVLFCGYLESRRNRKGQEKQLEQ